MKKCINENCDEGRFEGIGCNEGYDNKRECPDWKKTINALEGLTADNPPSPLDKVKKKTYTLSWTGNSLGTQSAKIITERSNPFLIGLIGAANSGKTTFLRMFYLMLRNGEKLKHWRFAGSYTLTAWESVAQFMEFDNNNQPSFPPHTTMSSGRSDGLLHLSLKNKAIFKDFVFSDTTGEWFTEWAKNVNSENAEGAMWLHDNSNAFVLFVDCEALIEKKWKAVNEITTLARRIKDNLDSRKVAILWSKADRYGEVQKSMVDKIQRQLKQLFEDYREFKISVYPDDNQHQSEVLEVFNWLFAPKIERLEFIPRFEYEDDFFFNYKG